MTETATIENEVRRGTVSDGGAAQLAGYAFMKAWMWLMFWTPIFDTLPHGTHAGLFGASLVANTVAFVAIAAFCTHFNPLGKIPWLRPLSAGAVCLGSAVLVAGNYVQGFPGALGAAAAALTGLGSAALLALWGENLSRTPVRQVLLCCLGATVFGGIACIAVVLSAQAVSEAMLVACPVASAICLRKSAPAAPSPEPDVRPCAIVPARITVVSLCFGLSFGLMRALGAAVAASAPAFGPAGTACLNLAAFVAAGIVVYVSAIVLKLDFCRLTFRITLPLIALGFAFLDLPATQPLALAMHNVGFQHIYIVLWTILAFHGARRDTPAGWLFACGMAALQAGQIVGNALGSSISPLVGGSITMGNVVEVCLLAVVLMALFVADYSGFNAGYNLIRPGEGGEARSVVPGSEEDVHQCCAIVARQHGLSGRESEVLLLLVQGYDRPGVAEKLFIGEETVKTHVKHIYQKMSLHNREELREMFERESARIRLDNYGL